MTTQGDFEYESDSGDSWYIRYEIDKTGKHFGIDRITDVDGKSVTRSEWIQEASEIYSELFKHEFGSDV